MTAKGRITVQLYQAMSQESNKRKKGRQEEKKTVGSAKAPKALYVNLRAQGRKNPKGAGVPIRGNPQVGSNAKSIWVTVSVKEKKSFD